MNKSFLGRRTNLLLLPLFCVFLWFKFESFFHHNPFLLGVWILLFFVILFLLQRYVPRNARTIIISLWTVISVLIVGDFFQHVIYGKFSESRFTALIDDSSEQIRRRAERIINDCSEASAQIKASVENVRVATQEKVFIHLQDHQGDTNYDWGLYDDAGKLIAWNGQLANKEQPLTSGDTEISVISQLHRQYVKFKQGVTVKNHAATLVILKPIGADYGIENRYLKTYNLLTDDLPAHPVLLYNSQSTTVSPDLRVRNFQITPDFSISALFQKSQYDQLLASREFKLHWWLEFLILIFCIYTSIFLFFEFSHALEEQQKTEGAPAPWGSWISLLICSVLSLLTVASFSAFGVDSAIPFSISSLGNSGLSGYFRSSTAFIASAFFAVVAIFSLAILLLTSRRGVRWKSFPINALVWLPGFVVVLFVFRAYFGYLSDSISSSSFDLTDFSFSIFSSSRLLFEVATMWLDLGFVLLIAILCGVLIGDAPRTRRILAAILLVQALSFGIFYAIARNSLGVPLIPFLVLYFGIALFVFFTSRLWNRLRSRNLLSRFLYVLLFLSCIDLLFYFARLDYSQSIRKEYVESKAAFQVVGQEDWIRNILERTEAQLDVEVRSVSLDPRISDLAYRLWSRTDFAVHGCRSAVEIYDSTGVLLNRFALNLPTLSLNLKRPEGTGWENREVIAALGNVRKPTKYGIRALDENSFLVVQVVQDYANLPFVASVSPFQELFRSEKDQGVYNESLFLTVYDSSWNPIFVSNAAVSPSTQKGKDLLRTAPTAWASENLQGRRYQVYYFRLMRGYAAFLMPDVSIRSQVVRLIDLLFFNLLWFLAVVLPLLLFFRRSISLYLSADTPVRFNFFQKLLVAFVIFTIIPMVLLSVLIRQYVWQKQINEVTTRSLTSFSVASVVVSDYLLLDKQNQAEPNADDEIRFSDGILEWIGQAIGRDVTLYYNRYLAATSKREFFQAGLIGDRINGRTYADLYLKGQKYSVSEMQIGSLKFLNVSGRLENAPTYRNEVISIPFMIDERSVEAEIVGFREYTMLVGAGLILFAGFLGYFLANRFSQPVGALIRGTAEMARGNLDYRIRAEYRDEFKQLVDSFNTMAGSLAGQQNALERRRAYIENIINNITACVISIDSTTNVTKINAAAAQRFLIDPDYQGLLDQLFAPGAEWTEVHRAFEQFLKDREQFQMKEVTIFQTNLETTLRLVYVPLFEEKRWNGGVFLLEDITDIIRSNRLSAWAEMARRVAHEVKNPLTPIQLAMEHLVRVYEDHPSNFGEVLKSCRDAVLKQVKTLRTLVSEFSQYGRPAVLHRSEVNLEAFLNELAASYHDHLPRDIRMKTDIEASLPALKIDSEKIRSSLMNIIENGLQAMNGNGLITIQARNGNGPFVSIQIRDTGTGIPNELLPRLFEPYFSTKSGGTGLGLAIARKNIEDHGGKIEVQSQPNKGTTVTILLPKAA